MDTAPSLKSLIKDHLYDIYLLDPNRWIMRKEMEKRPGLNKYSGHVVAIRCQEMARDKMISVRRQKVGGTLYAFYRFKPQMVIAWKKERKARDGKKRVRA